MASVQEIVILHSGRINDSKIWFAPNIPSNKLEGAINSYAQRVSSAEILMLVDNTIWGGCGDGMLITPEKLYAHDMGNSSKVMSISDIKSVNVVGSFAPELIINGSKFVTFNCIDIHSKSNHVNICLLINELSAAHASIGTPNALSHNSCGVTSPQECSGCGARFWKIGVCEYCGQKS